MTSTPRVVSVDLSCCDYRDFGIAVLAVHRAEIEAQLVAPAELGLSGIPQPAECARRIIALCSEVGASLLLLDGPQAWKHPDNGLIHSRVCERLARTPAKTGLPGQVKPAAYSRFVRFSIAVFDELVRGGAKLLTEESPASRPDELLAMESFPYHAWLDLMLPALPSKRKATLDDVRNRLSLFVEHYAIRTTGELGHDALQALVAGLAAAAIVRGEADCYRVLGRAPLALDGTMREGYIVSPCRPSAKPSAT